MALGSTLYRVTLDLSDVDRAVYESLDLRVACHPSESEERLVTRVLAYALLYEDGIEFGRGLSDSEEPALWVRDLTGQLLHWIDVGQPSAERIHSASKKAARVSIVCHRSADGLQREMQKKPVHRAHEIQVTLIEPQFVEQLSKTLDRSTQWTLVHSDGELSVTVDGQSFATSLQHIPLPQ